MESSHLFNNLDDVFVHEDMVLADLLRSELDGVAPDHGVPELLCHVPMNSIAEVFDTGFGSLEDDGRVVV